MQTQEKPSPETQKPERVPVSSPLRRSITDGRQVKTTPWPFPLVVRGFADRKFYYAYLLSLLEKIPDPTVDTMCVRVENGRYVLCHHPEWYQYLVPAEAHTVIEHECLHIVLEHIPRFNRYMELWVDEIEKIKRAAVFNVAADLADNSILAQSKVNSLPKGALLPGQFSLPAMESMEYYIENLISKIEVKEVSQEEEGDEDDDGESDATGEHSGQTGYAAGSTGKGAKSKTKSGRKKGEAEGGDRGDERSEAEHDQTDEEAESAGDSDSPGAGSKDSQKDGDVGSEGGVRHEAASSNKLLDQAMKEQHDWKLKPEEGESVRDQITALEQHGYELVERAYDHITRMGPDNGRGLIPGFIKQMIERRRTPLARRWEQILKSEITQTRLQSQERRINVINPNRMALGSTFGLYGHNRDTLKFRVVVGIDTSGSMSDDVLTYGLGLVQEIVDADLDMDVKVIEYDTQIHKRYYLRRGSKTKVEVFGRGGTDFDCFFSEAKSGKDPDGKIFKPDLILNYTDGEAPMPSLKVRMSTKQVPLIWLLSQGGSMPRDLNGFGKVIKMDRR
jgi:predicted metal-dependent peptidase